DLVARAGQVVGAGAVRRRPRDDSLARFSQRSYQLAHVLERRHRHTSRAQVKDDALDPPVAGDPVEAFAELLDAQPRPSGEALPERSRRIWQRWKVFLEDEHDELGRPADRAADARDQPPQIAERKENHARPSGRSLLCVRGQPHPRRKRRYFPTAWGRPALLSSRRPLRSPDARPCLRSASTLRTPVPRDGG